MLRAVRSIRSVVWALAVCGLGITQVQAADTAVESGARWLEAQVQADGSLASEATSIALPLQARAETVQTLGLLGRNSAAVTAAVKADTSTDTELLARRAIALVAGGESAAALIAPLKANATASGGFGARAGYPANALDTSFTLIALRAAGATRDPDIAGALGFLADSAGADGGYGEGQRPYATAYALLALQAWRSDYDLAAAIAKTRAALLAMQSNGAYADAMENALATLALSATGSPSDAVGAVASLRATQSADGSWAGDAYQTALALRALTVAANTPTGPSQIVGEVLDGAGLPLNGATVSLAGTMHSAVTGSDGRFAIANVAAGDYRLAVTRNGYQTFERTLSVSAGVVFDAGRITLAPISGSAILRGVVTDTKQQLPQAGVTISLSGAVTLQTVTDAYGRYEFTGLPAGVVTVTASKPGYIGGVGQIELEARSTTFYSTWICPETETPPGANEAVLKGRVVRASDGSPVVGASVMIGSITGYTNGSGEFLIPELTPGAFAASVRMDGYLTVNLSGTLGSGVNDAGQIALVPGQSEDNPTASTIAGRIVNAANGAPVRGAAIQIDGAEVARTDDNGDYRAEGVEPLRFTLAASAAGYESQAVTVEMSTVGVYRVDLALAPAPEGTTFQILSLNATPTRLQPGAPLTATARIAYQGTEPYSALVTARIQDLSGATLANACATAAGSDAAQCEFAFVPGEPLNWSLNRVMDNLPAGSYRLALFVVEPETMSASNPLGTVLARSALDIEVLARPSLTGSVNASPPVTIPDSAEDVSFSTMLLNDGNAIVPAGQLRLQVRPRGETTVVHESLGNLEALKPGDIVEVSFDRWKPETRGQYDLFVAPVDPTVAGSASGSLVVGDAARGKFTVTPDVITDGDSTVSGRIEITGVDHPEGESADPLFTLVRQAVTRGGKYTADEAKAWQGRNNCLGCHVQTQSLYGLASSLGKADIEEAAATYLHNSQSANINSSRAIYNQHYMFPLTQSLLGLWSMPAWPDKAENFNARYRVAKYLLTRKTQYTANRAYWWYDHPTGWLVENPAATATAVQGIASVLRDMEANASATASEYSGTVRARAADGLADIDGGPDGKLYALQRDGRVFSLDPATNALTYFGKPVTENHGLAITVADDGAIYVAVSSAGNPKKVIERVSASGSEVVLTMPETIDGIDVLPDGRLALLGYASRTVYIGNPTDGSVQKLTSGQLLPTNARGITALSDGSMLVSGSHSGWQQYTVRVSPTGEQRRAHTGVYSQVSDIVVAPDGSLIGGGSDAIYRLGENETVERFQTGMSHQFRLAYAGDRLYGINYWYGAELVEWMPSELAMASDREQMRKAVEDAASHFETYSNLGVPAQAFRLMMLAEARPFIADAALAARVDQRIPELELELRNAQRADGGWARANGYASDPVTTSIVGTALDYRHPESTDPVLRKTVDYLLRTQRSDGAWTGQYFPGSLLGPTSYVMAYLPKAVARLGGIDVGMTLDMPGNIALQQPSVAPESTSALPDGGTRYQFDIGRVDAAGSQLNFGLQLLGMLPLEQRAAASSASLTFRNSFNGELVSVPIAIPLLRAEGGYALELSLNRDTFYANEQVDILPLVRNVSSSYTSGSLRYFIETADGMPVAELDPKTFDGMTAGTQQTVPHGWNTGSTFAGDYRVRVQLLGPEAVLMGEAQLPFRILPGNDGAPTLSGQVSTDKAEYDVHERVTISGRVRNETSNLSFVNLRLDERVTAPNGDTVFTASAEIPQLLPSALQDRTFPFDLDAAAPGEYRVLQTVSNADGAVLDTREAVFRVRSTADSGAGLEGTIEADPSTVEQDLSTQLSATVSNRGNADLAQLPVSIAILDPASETVLWRFDTVTDVVQGGTRPLAADWQALGVTPGDYVAALLATVGGNERTLAYTPIKVIEPPVQAELSLELTTDNRLLVLVTCRIGNGQAEDAQCVEERVAFLDALLTDMGISHTLVTTTERFQIAFRSGRYNTYWISGGAEKLANTLAEEVREAAFRGEALLVDGSHDSRNQILDAALGVVFRGQLAHDEHRVLVDSEDLGQVEYAATGDALKYDLAGATVHGRFDASNGDTALTANRFGRGKAILHAYDLVLALQSAASAEPARATLDQSLRWLLGTSPLAFPAGGYVPVTATVENLRREAPMELEVAALDPLRIEDTAPTADVADDHAAYWAFVLAEAETKQFDLGVRVPDQDGSFPLSARVQHVQASGERELDVANLDLAVVSLASSSAKLLDDLRALSLKSSERSARDKAVGLIETGLSELSAGDVDAALMSWLRAIDELAKIGSVETAPYRASVGDLMGIAQRRWRPAAD